MEVLDSGRPGVDPGPLVLEVLHEVPGRLRARCPGLRAEPDRGEALQALGHGLPGVEEISIRPGTQCVVFRYSLEETDPRAFRAALRRRLRLETPRTLAASMPPRPVGARLIQGLRRGWDAADRGLYQQSGGLLDLRSSVPWVMLLLALRQIALNPALPALPWYTALYYSVQAILRYPLDHEAPDPGPEGE